MIEVRRFSLAADLEHEGSHRRHCGVDRGCCWVHEVMGRGDYLCWEWNQSSWGQVQITSLSTPVTPPVINLIAAGCFGPLWPCQNALAVPGGGGLGCLRTALLLLQALVAPGPRLVTMHVLFDI